MGNYEKKLNGERPPQCSREKEIWGKNDEGLSRTAGKIKEPTVTGKGEDLKVPVHNFSSTTRIGMPTLRQHQGK